MDGEITFYGGVLNGKTSNYTTADKNGLPDFVCCHHKGCGQSALYEVVARDVAMFVAACETSSSAAIIEQLIQERNQS